MHLLFAFIGISMMIKVLVVSLKLHGLKALTLRQFEPVRETAVSVQAEAAINQIID